MARVVDVFLVYQFVRRLVTPFKNWDAYKLGIIDDKGKVLRRRKTLDKPEEQKAWGWFDILVANLKKLIGQLPGGESKLASWVTAGLLLKEQKKLEEMSEEEIEQYVAVLLDKLQEEDGPVNVASSGAVAGLDDNPPVTKKKKKELVTFLKRYGNQGR